MGEKKKKEATQKNWKKVLFVVAAILFIVVMVVSSMGMSWISGIAPIRAGDTVVIDYTIYDSSGIPFMTTSQQLYKDQASKGQGIMFTKQFSLTANQSYNQAIYPLEVYIPSSSGGSWQEFALYNPEYNAISHGVVGMRTNEIKKIVFPTNNTMTTLFTPADLKSVNINMTSLSIGESLLMGVSETRNASAPNSTAASYIRLGEVTRKSDAGAVVDFGYPYAEVTIKSFAHT